MKRWYDIKAAANDPKRASIAIFDEIGGWGIRAKDFIDGINALGEISAIDLSINSPGGSVFDGFAIYNYLRGRAADGVEVNVKVMGVAASIASVIMLAGDKRTMPSNTMVMAHKPWTGIYGNADELRDMADVLDKMGASLSNIYQARTGMEVDAVTALLAKDSWLSAAEAQDMGFATEVIDEVAVEASYPIERFPEAARAVFAAANAEREDEPDESVEPVESVEPIEPAAAARRVIPADTHARIEAAGFADYAQAWIEADRVGAEQIAATLAHAADLKDLFKRAELPAVEASALRGLMTLDDARAAIRAERAKADEDIAVPVRRMRIDANDNGRGVANAGQPPVTTASVWAARNKSFNQRRN